MTTHPQHFQHELLIHSLTKIFGEFDSTMLELLEPKLDWIEISGGETLFHQNDAGNALFFVISGRLQALIAGVNGTQKVICEIIRGETVGEMAVFTGEPRSATIRAIRDSLLVRLSKEVFEEVISAYPGGAMNVTRLIINRLQATQNPRKPIEKLINICLTALHNTLDLTAFAAQLEPVLGGRGSMGVVTSTLVDAALNRPGLAQVNKFDSRPYR